MKNSKDPSFKEDQTFHKNYHFMKMFFLLWFLNKINKKSHLIANKLKQFVSTYKAELKENNVQLDKEYKRNYVKWALNNYWIMWQRTKIFHST